MRAKFLVKGSFANVIMSQGGIYISSVSEDSSDIAHTGL